MALAKDKGRIVLRGGGVLKVREITDEGAALGTPGVVKDLGYIAKCKLSYNTTEVSVADETGAEIASLPGETTCMMTGNFLQSDVDLNDFLRDETKNKFYQVYWKATPTGGMDGKTQEVFAGICKIRSLIEIESGVRQIPFEIKVLENASAISLTGLTSSYGSAADTATIAANACYEIVETA